MTATALPVAEPASAASQASAPERRGLLWLAALVVVAWVLSLAVMTYRTANPPVINWVQIDAADLVLLGHIQPGTLDQFQVERELKHGKKLETVTILQLPTTISAGTGDWVIPVTKTGDAYMITSGEFPNRPQRFRPPADMPIWKVSVSPQVYPATDDVLHQLDEFLQPAAVAKP